MYSMAFIACCKGRCSRLASTRNGLRSKASFGAPLSPSPPSRSSPVPSGSATLLSIVIPSFLRRLLVSMYQSESTSSTLFDVVLVFLIHIVSVPRQPETKRTRPMKRKPPAMTKPWVILPRLQQRLHKWYEAQEYPP